MTSATKFILLAVTFVSMALAETVEDIADCPDGLLSVGASDVNTYECKTEENEWMKPVFTVGTPAATVAVAPKASFYDPDDKVYQYKFPLDNNLVFSAVTTCPEQVTKGMVCDQLILYIGMSFDSAGGSPLKIGSAGGAGLSEFKCTEGATTVYYNFFIKFSDDDTATASGDIKDSVDAIAAIRTDQTKGAVADSAKMKPAAFQKFGEVNENTMTYYVKTSAAAYKIFKSDATTVTLTKGDYKAAFDDTVTDEALIAAVCDDAMQVLFKGQSGSSNIYAQTMLLFAPFILSLFN